MAQPQGVKTATMELLEEKIRARTARVGIVGLGLCGAAAGRGIRQRRIQRHRHRYQRREDRAASTPAIPTSATSPPPSWRRWCNRASCAPPPISPPCGELDTINICVPTPLRKTKDPDMSYIVVRLPGDRQALPPGMLVILESTTYPGTTDELVLPMLEKSGLKVGRRFLPVLLAGARGSGQPQVPDREHPEGGGRHHAGVHRNGAAVLRAGAGDGGAGELHAGGGDGEAAREHLPHDQHRPGERDGADVRPHGHQRLGSDRRRRHQALRLHAVLSRARAWAATASRSTRSICRGRPSRRASRRASSNWPATSTARCRTSSWTRCRTR